MKRGLLFLSALAAMVAVAALAAPRESGLLVLQWAAKGEADPCSASVAVLIEMGLKDTSPRDWSGRGVVVAARVTDREGYRWHEERLGPGPEAWEASSHRGMRVPRGQPQISKAEGIASVGVVFHLENVKEDATLTVEPKDKTLGKAVVQLREVLAGKAQKLWGGQGVARLVSTALNLGSPGTEDDFPAAAYGPDGTVWFAHVSYTLRTDRHIEQGTYDKQPGNFASLYKPDFADQVFVRYNRGNWWSDPVAVTGPRESIARCAIGFTAAGEGWIVYSAHRRGGHRLYGRPLRLEKAAERKPAVVVGDEQELAKGQTGDVCPVLTTAQSGDLWLTCQSSRPAPVLRFRKGKWEEVGAIVPPGGQRCWYPAIAAAPGGTVAVAYDIYKDGDYDVQVALWDGDKVKERTVAGSAKFEARPSIVYDPRGRLWIAYEEGPERWGKDYGALVPGKGQPLYSARSVRVVCLDTDGTLKRPVAELPTSTVEPPVLPFEPLKTHKYEKAPRYAYPQIGIDGKGRVWLTYRRNFGSRYTTHPGAYWLTFARRLDGDHWSEEIEVARSDGLLDSRPVLLPHKNGGLLLVHNTDQRYSAPTSIHNVLLRSYLTLPGEPVEPKLVPHEAGERSQQAVQQAHEQNEAVKRIRAYRVKAGGREYRLLRGEFHRHTEMSWDGSPDGSLEDMFRYALDAAALDWIGNGDHDNGAGREYSWWLTQKFTDAYLVPGRFTPMFSYERSVSYPHGHRNCMFAKRGVLTLPRLAPPEGSAKKDAPGGVHPDDTKMLYRYLKEMGGICASHTSATGMGTDWRDNDPAVEPIVEIYQGDRMSYEQEGAPRAGYEPKTGKEPANVAGWYPKGFINNALEKGYRLGFQASSDHWSTHISYFVVLAEKNDRESLLEAIKKRHCYAATDNIVLDVRSGVHVMGDEVQTTEAPSLDLQVLGTGKLARIDVLRDSEVVATLKAEGQEYRGTWTEPAPQAGTHYYYVRVLQADGELAWGSPLWFRR